uniref:Uncharacterized protein n=1 Tax=Meloidogyne floridensis TaxID=298350 RepID=A0A915NM86_9BILA
MSNNNNNNMHINIANFLDWCGNRPRMLALVGLLLTCSLFILFFGEYVEENLGTNKFFRRQIQSDPTIETDLSNQKSSNLEQQNICSSIPTNNSSNNFTVSIFQNCQKCSDFERNALQIEHCNPTGYYNAYICTDNFKNNSTVYVPCYTKSSKDKLFSFYTFAFASFLSTASCWTFVKWRREFLEQRSFGRPYTFQRVPGT